ncbi:MAG TPA: hypothetical protein VGF97_10865 [Rhizomicrobium sp.]|jgi:hypothetical protein
MLTFLFGIFAVIWSAIFATVGITLLFVFLIPLILFAIVFRIGLLFFKLAAGAVLLCLLALCLI